MAHFVLVPDTPDETAPGRVELFADARDVNSVPQVAEAFGVCPQTIRRLIASGELGSVHVGTRVMVTKRAMVDFFERQEVRS